MQTDSALAVPTRPVGVTTTVVSAQSVTMTWTNGADDTGTTWSVRYATNSSQVLAFESTLTPTSTKTFTFTGLATNTLYYFSVASADGGVNATSTATTSSVVYTLAATPGALAVVTSTEPTRLSLTFDAGTVNSNRTTASTTFIVKDTASTSIKYLQADGTWGSATATLTYAQLGSGSATNTQGLVANSQHILSVAAVNGDSTATTTFGGTGTTYTTADVPTSVSLDSQTAAGKVTVSWSGNGTDYRVVNNTNASSSAYISGTSLTEAGLTCGVSNSYQVKARNALGVETSLSTSTAVRTQLCPSIVLPATSGGGGEGGGSSMAVSWVPPVSSVPAQPTTPVVVVVPPVSTPVVTTPPAIEAPSVVLTPPVVKSTPMLIKFTPKTTLKMGDKGAAVKQLQQALNKLGFTVAKQGPGSPGKENGSFGPATQAALKRFQQTYQAELLKPQGLKKPTGVAAKASLTLLNSLLKGENN